MNVVHLETNLADGNRQRFFLRFFLDVETTMQQYTTTLLRRTRITFRRVRAAQQRLVILGEGAAARTKQAQWRRWPRCP